MLYIVGVNHSVQFKNDDLSLGFLVFVKNIIDGYVIEIIAEEWSNDANSLWKIKESNLSLLSKELNKYLIQFEPNEIDKNKFGIMTRLDIRKKAESFIPSVKTVEDIKQRKLEKERLKKQNYIPREIYWLEKIKPYLNKNILIICGNDHITTFCSLLLKNSINNIVLSKDEWILDEHSLVF